MAHCKSKLSCPEVAVWCDTAVNPCTHCMAGKRTPAGQALTIQSCGRRETLHVGGGHDVLQERVAVREGRVHSHLVLPFKLGPHVPAEVGAHKVKSSVR